MPSNQIYSYRCSGIKHWMIGLFLFKYGQHRKQIHEGFKLRFQDRKSTRLNSSHLPYTTLFRSWAWLNNLVDIPFKSLGTTSRSNQPAFENGVCPATKSIPIDVAALSTG